MPKLSSQPIKSLTDLEVLQTIAKFGLQLEWEAVEDDGRDEREDDCDDDPVPTEIAESSIHLSVFPSGPGGTWFSATLNSTPEKFEAEKLELIRSVVSRVAHRAQFSKGGSITERSLRKPDEFDL